MFMEYNIYIYISMAICCGDIPLHRPEKLLVGGAITILKNMKVSGKDYPIYYGKCLKPPTSISFYCMSQLPWVLNVM